MTAETKKAPYGMITGTRLLIAAGVAVILYFSSTLFNARTQMNFQESVTANQNALLSNQHTIISNQERIIEKIEKMQMVIEKAVVSK